MKRSKIVSLLLSLSLLAALAVPGTLAQSAEAADGQEENEGMEVNKYATANDDGTYTITLEAYATGEKIITGTTKEIPADIVLVLDQSGSMSNSMTTIGFREYSDTNWTIRTSNEFYYSMRTNQDWDHNKNLWYQPKGSNEYYSVSVFVTEGSLNYTPIEQGMNNSTGWGGGYTNYWINRNNLYAFVNGEYQKVRVDRKWNRDGWFDGYYTYTYTLPNGTEIASSEEDNGIPNFVGIDNDILYLASVDDNTRQYTYTYTDASGQTITIGTSYGAETQPEFDPFYEQYEDDISRLEALKGAVRGFVDNINTKAAGEDGQLGTDDDVNHRVAVVGFASESGNGNNTELLSINGYNSGSVGIAYNSITEQNYREVLQDMDTLDGQSMVSDAINALTANGATRADLGMEMANSILNANPVAEGDTRARVVVFFTDGSPTSFDGFEVGVAVDAINNAYTIKNGGATVYSVGIFSGANGTPVSSWNGVSNENKFMHLTSSNFRDTYLRNEQSFDWVNVGDNTYPEDGSSYYLSASDTESLNSIFQQISDEIEEGGASTTLDENAVIRDVIAPSFTLPEGTDASDVVLKTYSYVGENEWTENNDSMGAHAIIIDDTVSVTGFDFADNWCGIEETSGATIYRGNKLVISFQVVPKEGFLGGNNVPTNTSAGVYEDDEAKEPVFDFPVPEANVPIGDVTVTAKEKNIYLLGDLTVEQIKSGATAKCGGGTLNLGEENYGLADWQDDYVDIIVTYTDTEGNTLKNLQDLDEDTSYTVQVTVRPKETSTTNVGTPNGTSGVTNSGTGNINVFKPELTYKDGEVWYGDYAPTEYSTYLEETQWKHGETLDSAVTMIGEEPSLELEYAPESGTITLDNKVDTKEDIAVNVTVEIDNEDVTSNTTFQHADCTGKPCGKPENGAFWLHINTCELTVTKTGGVEGEPYVFTVLKDNGTYTSLTIKGSGSVTIKELPVGSYSIQEDENWSWRYNGTEGDAVTLSSSNPYDTISCENVKDEDTWLNNYSPVIKNIYGEEQTVVNE